MVPFETAASPKESLSSSFVTEKPTPVRQTSDSQTTAASSCSSVTSVYIEDDYPLGVEKVDLDVFLRPEDDEKSQTRTNLAEDEKCQRLLEYWKEIVEQRKETLGPTHIRTAEALMNLGNAQLSGKDCKSAGKTYLEALKIYQTVHGDLHLSVALALDKVGLAASMTHQNLDLALTALSDALKIRCELLGPGHIDSVDSLNNVAGVRLNRREFGNAAENYRVVLRYRCKIFGINHPSVAVTAHNLACIEFDQLLNIDEARQHFRFAYESLRSLGLRNSPYYQNCEARLEQISSMEEV